jgi:hypothetical protein
MTSGGMKKAIIIGALAVAVFAGVIYFARDSGDQLPAAAQPSDERARAETAKPVAAAPAPAPKSGTPSRPATTDPRLAALMVSPDNALIEFVPDDTGKVIKEIDNDPNSAGYRKPLREYMYAGDRVVGLVSYKYLGDQVQVVKAAVSYKPDGSVDHYQESTSYEHGKKRN